MEIVEIIPASRKLQAEDARKLLETTSRLIVTKGKRVKEFVVSESGSDEIIDAMLGPTGNLRAPMLRIGHTILVGFNEEAFLDAFG